MMSTDSAGTPKGEQAQFLATDHHDAIISREDFAAVSALISQGQTGGIFPAEAIST
jgi:hypothetical protein